MELRKLRRLVIVIAIGITASGALAQEAAPEPVARLKPRDAIVLGIVEGVTEFLPISSTGHLIIANQALGLEDDVQLTGRNGEPLWYKKPSGDQRGEALTLKLAADTYAVVIQVGAIAAVVLMYWQQFVNMLVGVFGRNSQGFRLLRNVVLAFVPVAFIGFLAHDLIDHYLFSVQTVIFALIAGAALMLWAERWRKRNTSAAGYTRNDPADLSAGKALGIGFAQCLALWPGMSRSMVTIVGGYLTGLSPVKAAEFSFLVGLPTLAGAAVYKSYKSGPAMIEVFGWGSVLLGGAVAAVSAAIAVRFLVTFLSKNGLAVFAYYRLAMAAVLAWFTWF